MKENNIAVYAGSFDPFTYGHLDVLVQASQVFDQVYVFIADNESKKRRFGIEVSYEALKKTVTKYSLNNVSVVFGNDLTIEICKMFNAKYIVRGLRDTTDFLYEENLAKINKVLDDSISTVYFRANNEALSSSMVYELYKRNKDFQTYVPLPIYKMMKSIVSI